MTEVGNKEISTPKKGSHSLPNRFLERLDNHYTPDYIKNIHNRNDRLWHLSDPEQFRITIEQWISEIRDGSPENKGLITLGRQTEQPHVTIVIPTYNEERKILQVLQSIAAQDYNKGIEIIVVDNNSDPEDRTAEFAQKCGATVIKYTLPDDSPNKKLSQIALARQKGLEAALGSIVVSTDSDVIAPREWLRLMAEPLDSNEKIAAVAGPVAHYERGDKPRVLFRDVLSQYARPLRVGQLNRTNPQQISMIDIRGVTPGANTAFRKADAMKISGYDTKLYPGEDTNLGLRLLRLGKIKYLKSAAATVWVSPRRYADITIMEGWKRMRKRGVNSNTMLYLDENGNPIIKR